MLEICEIEVLATRLHGALRGAMVRAVETSPRWTQLQALSHRPITQVVRHGKALIFEFGWSDPDFGICLACRFGRSGIWHLQAPGQRRHRSFVCALPLELKDGSQLDLVFEDPHRAASLELAPRFNSLASIAAYGPDLRTVHPDWLHFCCARHPRAVKILLLRPEYFAGIGNRLANEILFRAHIHPGTLGTALKKEQIARLHASLILAIETGITALERGEEPVRYVYGRAKQNCDICLTIIQKIMTNGRSTYFCPSCQASDWAPPAPASSDFVAMVAKLTGEGGDVQGSRG